MAKTEKSKREQARLMFLRSRCTKTATEIGKALGVSPVTVRSWRRRDKWDADPKAIQSAPGNSRSTRKPGAPAGNKNAVEAQRQGNQNAAVTGEHTRITPDSLTDDERKLIESKPEDYRAALQWELDLLTVREHRMMQCISNLQSREDPDGLMLDLSSDTTRQTSVGGQLFTNSSNTRSRSPSIDRIIRVEEALTRIQAKKARILLAIHEHETQEGGASSEGLTIVYDYGDNDMQAD